MRSLTMLSSAVVSGCLWGGSFLKCWARDYPLRPNGLPSTSSSRHGLTECRGPPHSAHRSRAESCAMVSPVEIAGADGRSEQRVSRAKLGV